MSRIGNDSKGEQIFLFVIFLFLIVAGFVLLRGCYGWCCDRLAESLSRVNGGDKYVVVADGFVVKGDVDRITAPEAHGAVEDHSDAVLGAILDSEYEARARGSVNDHGSYGAHGAAKHVYLVFRLEAALPKKED